MDRANVKWHIIERFIIERINFLRGQRHERKRGCIVSHFMAANYSLIAYWQIVRSPYLPAYMSASIIHTYERDTHIKSNISFYPSVFSCADRQPRQSAPCAILNNNNYARITHICVSAAHFHIHDIFMILSCVFVFAFAFEIARSSNRDGHRDSRRHREFFSLLFLFPFVFLLFYSFPLISLSLRPSTIFETSVLSQFLLFFRPFQLRPPSRFFCAVHRVQTRACTRARRAVRNCYAQIFGVRARTSASDGSSYREQFFFPPASFSLPLCLSFSLSARPPGDFSNLFLSRTGADARPRCTRRNAPDLRCARIR